MKRVKWDKILGDLADRQLGVAEANEELHLLGNRTMGFIEANKSICFRLVVSACERGGESFQILKLLTRVTE